MSSWRWNAETTFGRKFSLGYKATWSLWTIRKGSLQEMTASSNTHLVDVMVTRNATLHGRSSRQKSFDRFKRWFLKGRVEIPRKHGVLQGELNMRNTLKKGGDLTYKCLRQNFWSGPDCRKVRMLGTDKSLVLKWLSPGVKIYLLGRDSHWRECVIKPELRPRDYQGIGG